MKKQINEGRKFSILSIVFAVLSLITLPIVFGPLGVIFGIIAVIALTEVISSFT